MIEAPTMNRVIDCLPEIDLGKIWSLFKVTEPRFEKVMSIMDKHQDIRELPEPLAEVYRDNELGKLLLAQQISYDKNNRFYQSLTTLFEIKDLNQLQEKMSRTEVLGVRAKVPPVDVAEDLISFLQTQAQKDGYIFKDQHKRFCTVKPNVPGTLRMLLG